MKTEYKYIKFTRCVAEEISLRRKTEIWRCHDLKFNPLCVVKWHGPWRQYCFFPIGGSLFNRTCADDISHFMKQLMDERKK